MGRELSREDLGLLISSTSPIENTSDDTSFSSER